MAFYSLVKFWAKPSFEKQREIILIIGRKQVFEAVIGRINEIRNTKDQEPLLYAILIEGFVIGVVVVGVMLGIIIRLFLSFDFNLKAVMKYGI